MTSNIGQGSLFSGLYRAHYEILQTERIKFTKCVQKLSARAIEEAPFMQKD